MKMSAESLAAEARVLPVYERDIRYDLLIRTLGEVATGTSDETGAEGEIEVFNGAPLNDHFDYLAGLLATSLLEPAKLESADILPEPGAAEYTEHSDVLHTEIDTTNLIDLLTLIRNGVAQDFICEIARITSEDYDAWYEDLASTLAELHTSKQTQHTADITAVPFASPPLAQSTPSPASAPVPRGRRLSKVEAAKQALVNIKLRLPVLKADEEVALMIQFRAGMAAEERLASIPPDEIDPELREELEVSAIKGKEAFYIMRNSNMGLVGLTMRNNESKIRQAGITDTELLAEDLVEFGIEVAIRRFDINLGLKFSSYAMWWTRKALNEAIARQLPIPMSPTAYVNRLRVSAFIGDFVITNDRRPTDDEVLEAFPKDKNITRSFLRYYYQTYSSAFSPLSLEQPMLTSLDEEGDTLRETIADHQAVPVEDQVIDSVALNQVLGALTNVERLCIELHFGLTGGDPMPASHIGRLPGLPNDPKKIIQRAKAKMRSLMTEPKD